MNSSPSDAQPTKPTVVEFTHTVDESVRASAAVLATRSAWIHIAYIVVGAAALAVWLLDASTRRSPLEPWILSTGVVCLTEPLWRPVWVRFSARRRHPKLASADKPVRWTISHDTLHVHTAVTESRVAWNAFSRVVELPDGFILFIHPRIGHWLPKHGFKSEADVGQLRALIEQRGIPFRRK